MPLLLRHAVDKILTTVFLGTISNLPYPYFISVHIIKEYTKCTSSALSIYVHCLIVSMFEQQKYWLGVSRYRYVYVYWNTCVLSDRTDIEDRLQSLYSTFTITFERHRRHVLNVCIQFYIELYIILKLRISSFRIWTLKKIHIWQLFGGFVMQGHIKKMCVSWYVSGY